MAYRILKEIDEPNCKSLDKILIDCIKRSAYQSLKINKNKKTINISSDELKGLKPLLNNKSIVIMRADKGKINTIENVIKKMETKLNYTIYELKRIKKLSKKEHSWLRAAATRCPVLFCQPKVHKNGMPLRPIISTSNSYNYNLSKHLRNLLEKARTKSNSYIKDSFIFAKLIQQQKPNKNDFMTSLDVESLFTSIPLHESIELATKTILEKKKNDPSFTRLEENDLRQLFELCVTNRLAVERPKGKRPKGKISKKK